MPSDIIPLDNYSIFNFDVLVLVRTPVYVSFTVQPKLVPIPVAARSKASVCGRSLAGIVGSNIAGNMDVYLLQLLCVVQVEVSATGLSLVQRSPTECLSVVVKSP